MKSLSQLDLFEKIKELKIEKIDGYDAIANTDKIKRFLLHVSKHEDLYPDIVKWIHKKVIPGLKSNERVAYLGLIDEKPVVSAIIKIGEYSKFCHLHIEERYRDHKIGDLFFSMMAVKIRNIAKEAHFTLPESLWLEKKEFFSSFGFSEAIISKKQYRKTDSELRCSVPFNIFWNQTLSKLPKIITNFNISSENIFSGLLMSLKPENIEKIASGEKHIEIRKKFSAKWIGCRITIYSSKPSHEIHGHARIGKVDFGIPDIIWKKYNDKIACSEKKFYNYVGDSKKIYAIRIKDFKPYIAPILLDQIRHLTKKNLMPPPNYISLINNKKWAEAVAIAELLQGSFQFYSDI